MVEVSPPILPDFSYVIWRWEFVHTDFILTDCVKYEKYVPRDLCTFLGCTKTTKLVWLTCKRIPSRWHPNENIHPSLIPTKTDCIHFISMNLANLSSLQMCPVLDALSHCTCTDFLQSTIDYPDILGPWKSYIQISLLKQALCNNKNFGNSMRAGINSNQGYDRPAL